MTAQQECRNVQACGRNGLPVNFSRSTAGTGGIGVASAELWWNRQIVVFKRRSSVMPNPKLGRRSTTFGLRL
jgi:hypothetical protein